MTNQPKFVPLAQLSRELAVLTGQSVPTYRMLWNMVASGKLPAEQERGRYRVDLHAAAAALGLKPASDHVA